MKILKYQRYTLSKMDLLKKWQERKYVRFYYYLFLKKECVVLSNTPFLSSCYDAKLYLKQCLLSTVQLLIKII